MFEHQRKQTQLSLTELSVPFYNNDNFQQEHDKLSQIQKVQFSHVTVDNIADITTDAAVLYLKGLQYYFGLEVKRNLKAAAIYFEAAIERGSSAAANFLGIMYFQARGVERSNKKGFELLKISAAAGDRDGQYNLGLMGLAFEAEDGHDFDPLKLLELAAENHNEHAIYLLGCLYRDGMKVEANPEKAFEYFGRIALLPHVNAMLKLAEMYYRGEGVESPDLLRAFHLWTKAAAEGNLDGHYHRGLCFISGRGTEPNYQEALCHLFYAADNGHAEAAFTLGQLYANDQIMPPNEDERIKYYELAMKLGHAEAPFYLAGLHMEGDPLRPDKEGIALLRLSAERGSADAQLEMAMWYLNGYEGKPDYKRTMDYLQQAGSQGKAEAFNQIGALYLNAKGVDEDKAKGMGYILQAAKLGHQKSIELVEGVLKIGIGQGNNVYSLEENNNKVARPTAPKDITTERTPDKPFPKPPPKSELNKQFSRALTSDDMAEIMQLYVDRTGHSLRKIGEDAGVNHSYISRMLKGKVAVDTSIEIFEQLGFSIHHDIEIEIP